MDSDNREKIFCGDDGENRIYCHVCDKLAIDRYYNNHLKSQTHIKKFRTRQQLNNTNNSTTHSWLRFCIQLETRLWILKKVVSFN